MWYQAVKIEGSGLHSLQIQFLFYLSDFSFKLFISINFMYNASARFVKCRIPQYQNVCRYKIDRSM